MDQKQAAKTAKRISELWPKTTAEQIRVTTESLMRDEFAYDKVDEVIGYLYMENSAFFELSRLREIAGIVVPVNADGPNSVEAQTRRRARDRAELNEILAMRKRADEMIRGLSADELEQERDLFMSALADRPDVLRMYESLFKKNILPRSFVDWVYQRRTEKTGAEMAR